MGRLKSVLMSEKFRQRLLSGIILVVIAILVVVIGGPLLFAVTFLISLIGLFELYRVVKMEREPLGAVGYAAAVVYYLLLWTDRSEYFFGLFIAALMALMTVFVVTYPRYRTEQVSVGFFGIFYTAVMLSYLYRVREMADGKYLVWLIFLSSWGCDTAAYVVGMLIGKRHIFPVLSPKKTLAGCVGGVIGAGLLGGIFGAVFSDGIQELGSPVVSCALACAAAGLISQVGDLAASAIKRDHGVKDYGTLIPGHGGILDRFDSMLFTAPAIYFVIWLAGIIF